MNETGKHIEDVSCNSHDEFSRKGFVEGAGGTDRKDPGWDDDYDPRPFANQRRGLLHNDHRAMVTKGKRLPLWDPDDVEHWHFEHPQVGCLVRMTQQKPNARP